MKNNESFDNESNLNAVNGIIFSISILGAVILFFLSFVDETNWFMLGSSIGMILISIAYFFFVKVVIEISKSIKNRDSDNIEILLREISEKVGKIQSAQPKPNIIVKEAEQRFHNNSSKMAEGERKIEEQAIKKEETQKKKKVVSIDTGTNEFKNNLHKWGVLKQKGYIEQAIKEYQEYTGLDYEESKDFINSL